MQEIDYDERWQQAVAKKFCCNWVLGACVWDKECRPQDCKYYTRIVEPTAALFPLDMSPLRANKRL